MTDITQDTVMGALLLGWSAGFVASAAVGLLAKRAVDVIQPWADRKRARR